MPEPATIGDVLPSAARLLGVTNAADSLGLRHVFGDVERVLIILVDGMGLHLLPRMSTQARTPVIAAVQAGALGVLRELSSAVPSTTPTNLVSLTTGAAPGEHGILGFTVNVPGTDQVLTHIRWGNDPDPDHWQPVPTWFQRLAAAGVASSVVLPAAFRGSGLTQAAYRGAQFIGVRSRRDYVGRLLGELRSGRRLVYGYLADLDTAAHVYGIASVQWQDAAAKVDSVLQRLVEELPPNTVLLVTADHGGLDVPGDGRVDIDSDPRLARGLRVIAGEPRFRHLHVAPGAHTDVLDSWHGVLGSCASVLARDDAIDSGMFGPVSDRHRDRVGDVVVVCGRDTVVLATAHEPAPVAQLVGFHGGRSAAETAIPLIAFKH